MDDADVITTRRYCKFKRLTSSLSSRARLIGMVTGDSI
jgi:hypothetical protein